MRTILHCLILAAGLSLQAAHAAAPATPISPATMPKNGWFFYRDPPPSAAKPVPKPLPRLAGGAGSAQTPLSAAWLRENLQRYLDLATDKPTVENVQLYMHLQKVAMDKAQTFSQVQQVAVALDRTIDESARNPVSTFGKAAREEERSAARNATLRDLGTRVGIWYFYRSDCTFCMRQSPLLERLSETTGLQVLAISLDGAPMMDGSYPEYVVDDGHAAKLGVTVTPTMYIANGQELLPLATGLRTLPEIERRILTVAHGAGWLSDEAFTAASGSNALPVLDLSKPPANDTPEELLRYLRELNGHGATPVTTATPAPTTPDAFP